MEKYLKRAWFTTFYLGCGMWIAAFLVMLDVWTGEYDNESWDPFED